MQLVDIGVNLAHKSFARDLPEVIARARRANVTGMIVTGTSVASSERALEIATEHGLCSTVGVHPHEARRFGERTPALLRRLAREPCVVAVGECGLDYDRDFSPRPAQRAALSAQLSLAAELRLPVFLHEREAHADFRAIVAEHRSGLVGGVVHCFTGDARALDAYLELGLHIGITGFICDERRGTHLIELVRQIPSDRLMIETDAPFLLPRTLRPVPEPRRNEPAFLPHVLSAVARAVDKPVEVVASETTRAAAALFGRVGSRARSAVERQPG